MFAYFTTSEQTFRDMPAQELEDVDSPHCGSINEDSFVDPWLSPPELNNQLLGIANVGTKVVILAAFNLIFNFPPVLIIICLKTVVSSANIKMALELNLTTESWV